MSLYAFAGWQLEAGVDSAKILSITTWDCIYVSSLLVITLLLLTPTAAFANGSFTGLETSFSSPEGIAALIPSFRDSQGHFSVPDPTKHAAQFLQAQQTLTILIDQAETQALMAVTPDQLQKRMAKKTMRFRQTGSGPRLLLKQMTVGLNVPIAVQIVRLMGRHLF